MSFWACQLLGAVAVAVNAWLPAEGVSPEKQGPLTYCLSLTRCKVLVVDGERATTLEPWIAQGTARTGVSGVLVVRPHDADHASSLRAGWEHMKTWGAVMDEYKGPTDLWKREPSATLDEDGTIFFTSGT